MHKILAKQNYLLVTIEGDANFQDIVNAFGEELEREDYPNMNDIWDFTNCTILVDHTDYSNVTNSLLESYPTAASRTKTALVVSSEVSKIFLQIWADLSEKLPYEVKIFLTIEEAEAWIT